MITYQQAATADNACKQKYQHRRKKNRIRGSHKYDAQHQAGEGSHPEGVHAYFEIVICQQGDGRSYEDSKNISSQLGRHRRLVTENQVHPEVKEVCSDVWDNALPLCFQEKTFDKSKAFEQQDCKAGEKNGIVSYSRQDE